MSDTQIVNLIINRLTSHLTEKLQTDVADTEPSRATVVKAGRFLDDPKVDNIHVAIHGGDPEKLEFIDGLVSIEDFKDIGLVVPTREVGGSVAWWRRGVCQFGCYFLDGSLSEDNARMYAYEFYGRIQNNIENMPVNGLIDNFGEVAYRMFLVSASMLPSGGNGKWIWRGKVMWQCLTNKKG